MRSIIYGRYRESLFEIGDKAKTKSDLIGTVIGIAEYIWGFEYRLKIEGRIRTLYRKEEELRRAN